MSDDGSDDRPMSRLRSMRESVANSFAPGVLVRLQYASYLFFALLACLVLKNTGGQLVRSIPYLREGCQFVSAEHGSEAGVVSSNYASEMCYSNTFVYRTSFALFLFFALMFVTVSDLMCCIDDRSRARFQEGFFCWKSLILSALNLVTLFVPNGFFVAYAWVAMFVSAIFLIVQVMLLIDFSYVVNEEWGSRSEDNAKWQWYLALTAFCSYGSGIGLTIYSFVMFTPSSSCNFHGFVLVFNVVAAIIATAVAVWVPHGSIVPSGILFAYTSFLLLTALRLDTDAECNLLAADALSGVGSIKVTLVSAFAAAVALAYTVVSSSGADSAAAVTGGDDIPAPDAVGAGDDDECGGLVRRRRFDTAIGHLPAYCYFYLVMMAGSMYLAMLATDWSISGSADGATANASGSALGHGTAVAMWVKIVTSWLVVLMYLWSLLAPYFCCRDRDFGYNMDW